MKAAASQYLCLLILALQVLGAMGFARDAFLCIRPDGTTRLETASQVEECASERPAPLGQTTISEQGCVDLRVSSDVSARPVERSFSIDLALPLVALPRCYVVPTEPLAIPCMTRTLARALGVPDVDRASLGSIILVI